MSQQKETICAGVHVTLLSQRRVDAVIAVGSGLLINKRQRTGSNRGKENVDDGGGRAKSTSARVAGVSGAGKRGATAASSTRRRPKAATVGAGSEAPRTHAADVQSSHAISHRRPGSGTREGMRSGGVPSLSATGRPMRRSRQLGLPRTEDSSPASRTSGEAGACAVVKRQKRKCLFSKPRTEDSSPASRTSGGAGGCAVVTRRKRKRLFSKPVSWRVSKKSPALSLAVES